MNLGLFKQTGGINKNTRIKTRKIAIEQSQTKRLGIIAKRGSEKLFRDYRIKSLKK